MTAIHHLTCGYLHKPPGPRVVSHCLLLQDPSGLALVDTGIGLLDVQHPVERVGRNAIDAAGFQFDPANTAFRQIEQLGLRPSDVHHIVLTHADPDHAGGLADFPHAVIHLSTEEHAALARNDNPRYRPPQFSHGPRWNIHAASDRLWFGLEARPLDLGFQSETLLIPLFGHTLGHCGLAIRRTDSQWLLHVGDAYYLRVELQTDDHPVSQLAAANAVDDAQRRATLHHLRRLARDHADQVEMLGYHDPSEMPPPSD